MYLLEQTFNKLAVGCSQSTFFGIKPWYQYVPTKSLPTGCQFDFSLVGIGGIWLILAGIIDILLRVGALVAVGYFIYGAFKMVTSQGSPEGVKSARETMTNALIGLVITILATWIIGYIIRVIFPV